MDNILVSVPMKKVHLPELDRVMTRLKKYVRESNFASVNFSEIQWST